MIEEECEHKFVEIKKNMPLVLVKIFELRYLLVDLGTKPKIKLENSCQIPCQK